MIMIKITKVQGSFGKELPFDMSTLLALTPTGRPESELQAIMEAAPNTPEELSKELLQPLREAVVDCIDALSEQDRFIIDAMMSERITNAELGRRLGVSTPHAWRLSQQAMANVKVLLLKHPLIREHLGVDDE
jgi:DNA-directed RNA polymerase specialized sigma subunit